MSRARTVVFIGWALHVPHSTSGPTRAPDHTWSFEYSQGVQFFLPNSGNHIQRSIIFGSLSVLGFCWLKLKVRREIPARGAIDQSSQDSASEEVADSQAGVEQEAADRSTGLPWSGFLSRSMSAFASGDSAKNCTRFRRCLGER